MQPPQAGVPAERSVVVEGDNLGIVSTGDRALNVAFVDGRLQAAPSVLELPLREPTELPFTAGTRLFGRDELVERVVGRLAAGTSVQLHGLAGVGKKAIANAVHGELRAQGRRGHVLWPETGEARTLAALYRRLAGSFFGPDFVRPVDEEMLRQAVAGVSGVHITVYDCELGREDVARLLETFGGCTFLLTSRYRTLSDSDAAHHVQPLSRDTAIELFSAELALPLGPVGLQNVQFDHAYQEAAGRPQQILQFAQFISGSDAWRARTDAGEHDAPAEFDAAELSPRHQAEALAVALSEPARRVLVALATFDSPLSPAWFAPVTGDPQATGAGPELFDRRLVVRHGEVYEITADAAAAVRALGWAPADGRTAAEGLMSALTGPDAPEDPEPYLLLAVAKALEDAQQWAPASRFVGIAAPIALRAGRKQTVLQLYALGLKAATRSGVAADVDYYLRTGEQTRRLLDGDEAAAAAALVVLAALLREHHSALNPVTHVPRRALRSRHAVRQARRLLGAGHGAGAVGVVAVVASLTLGAVVGVHALSGSPSRTPAASAVGPGTDCGRAGSFGGTLDLVVTAGRMTCTEAFSVLKSYRAAPNRQGSGGFATVSGWSCGHSSIAGFDQDGVYEGCQKGSTAFQTRSSSAARISTAPATTAAQTPVAPTTPAEPRLTGPQLAQLLLPAGQFTPGSVAAPANAQNSGSTPDGQTGSFVLSAYGNCGPYATTTPAQEAFAYQLVQDTSTNQDFQQEVELYTDPATASAFFTGLRTQYTKCHTALAGRTTATVPSSVRPTTVDGRTAFTVTVDNQNTAPAITLVVLDGSFVLVAQDAPRTNGAYTPGPTPAQIITKLAASVATSSD